MPDRSELSSLLWRVEQEVVLTDRPPAASLVSVAFAGHAYFLVVRGDVPPVVERPFDPELDLPPGRLEVSLEVGGARAQPSSSGSAADRESWSALLQWEGVEPAPDLRVTLELDGRSCEYVLALVE